MSSERRPPPATPAAIPLTLYARLRDELRADILEGRLQPHDRLPSEHELAARAGVSRITVRQALDELRKQGLIVKVQGKGAFVSPLEMTATFDRIEGLGEAMAAAGHAIQNRRLSMRRVRAARVLAQELAIPPGTEVVALETLRYADRVPISVNRCWMPLAIGLKVARLDLSGRDLVDVYERDLGRRLARERVEVRATLPSSRQAKLLRVPRDLPCLEVKRLLVASDDAPIHYEAALYRGDIYGQRFDLRR